MSEKSFNPDSERENEQPGEHHGRFESDTQKLVRRHLEDPQHVITDEEMQQIRVGMTPPEGEQTTITSDEDELEEKEAGMLRNTSDDDTSTSDDKITPWDTVEPK